MMHIKRIDKVTNEEIIERMGKKFKLKEKKTKNN